VTRRPALGWVWLSLFLAGCASLFEDEIQPPCPRAVTVADAQTITVHQPGPGRDLTDVLTEGTITGFVTECQYDDEGGVDATVTVGLDLTIGPAARDNTGQWQYFILVTDPEEKFIAKRVFTVKLQFKPAVFRAQIEEAIQTAFDYAPWPDAGNFRIFVGFQLTRDQLEYLRSLKR
jgi:hypothetical protein